MENASKALLIAGYNGSGELGNGTQIKSNVPLQVKTSENTYLTGIKQISAGREFAAALNEDGEVYVWGSGYYGQLGQGSINRGNLLYATKLKQIKEEVIGTGTAEQPEFPREEKELKDIVQISAGDTSLFMVTKDGDVYGQVVMKKLLQ